VTRDLKPGHWVSAGDVAPELVRGAKAVKPLRVLAFEWKTDLFILAIGPPDLSARKIMKERSEKISPALAAFATAVITVILMLILAANPTIKKILAPPAPSVPPPHIFRGQPPEEMKRNLVDPNVS